MKLFICWSGDTSRHLAEALHDWMPTVIQSIEPWMSESDIEKGARWGPVIAQELQETNFGLVCLTSENLEAPWIHFEVGALAKAVEDAYIWTYLKGVEPSSVKQPLAQFQHTEAVKDDTLKLMRTINRVVEELQETSLTDTNLDATFNMWWPKLEERLNAIPEQAGDKQSTRDNRELLEEILEQVRGFTRQSTDSGANRARRWPLKPVTVLEARIRALNRAIQLMDSEVDGLASGDMAMHGTAMNELTNLETLRRDLITEVGLRTVRKE